MKTVDCPRADCVGKIPVRYPHGADYCPVCGRPCRRVLGGSPADRRQLQDVIKMYEGWVAQYEQIGPASKLHSFKKLLAELRRDLANWIPA